MSSPIAGARTHKAGSCPHGLPHGACPICSGMGGGGGISTRGRQPKAGELTWEQCYAIGQMMKAQQAAKKQTQELFLHQDQAAMLQRLMQNAAAIKTALLNMLPTPVIRALDGIKNLMLTPISQPGQKFVQTIQTTFANLTKFAQTLKEKFINITDKLNALFGEAKNALEKKISEKFKEVKKRIFNLFAIATADNDEDEELKQIEEKSRQMEMKEMHESRLNTNTLKKQEEGGIEQ